MIEKFLAHKLPDIKILEIIKTLSSRDMTFQVNLQPNVFVWVHQNFAPLIEVKTSASFLKMVMMIVSLDTARLDKLHWFVKLNFIYRAAYA